MGNSANIQRNSSSFLSVLGYQCGRCISQAPKSYSCSGSKAKDSLTKFMYKWLQKMPLASRLQLISMSH